MRFSIDKLIKVYYFLISEKKTSLNMNKNEYKVVFLNVSTSSRFWETGEWKKPLKRFSEKTY